MLNIFKKEHEELTTDLDTWVVRWNQCYGEFSSEIKEVAQFFTNKQDAEAFANSLQRATKFIGHTRSAFTWVKVEKANSNRLESFNEGGF